MSKGNTETGSFCTAESTRRNGTAAIFSPPLIAFFNNVTLENMKRIVEEAKRVGSYGSFIIIK